MTKSVSNVLFFLQLLHYRDDLESEIFNTLAKNTQLDSLAPNLFNQKVDPSLTKNALMILSDFGVIRKANNIYDINPEKLSAFREMVETAKASRDYDWPASRFTPFLFISPPGLISASISGDVSDISTFLTDLVRSAKKTITIMSPFTNKEGLASILTPLKACTDKIAITLYLTASENDKEMIYKQIIKQVPQKMVEDIKIYYCSADKIPESNQPHAKVLTTDSKRGYLGSANFTKQGLTTRFELGIELDEQQSLTIEKLLDILVSKDMFQE
jgi:phosphatidylserine/phosphatidylglycerophosphate/cardiolipin synthase-like enzyme